MWVYSTTEVTTELTTDLPTNKPCTQPPSLSTPLTGGVGEVHTQTHAHTPIPSETPLTGGVGEHDARWLGREDVDGSKFDRLRLHGELRVDDLGAEGEDLGGERGAERGGECESESESTCESECECGVPCGGGG